jgi:hypothetical protein
VLVNLTYTFFDVKIEREGFATPEFLLGNLQQPQRMNVSDSPDSITCKKNLRREFVFTLSEAAPIVQG